MQGTKISVIVPVYKTEPFLRQCLDSIAHQTHKNLEIILVDDGSPDNCGAICDEYAQKDGRFAVLHLSNGGVSAARNAALRVATGDWIGFVDSDDLIEPDMFEYLLTKAEAYSADVVQCGFFFVEGESCEKSYCMVKDTVYSDGALKYSVEELKTVSPSVWNKLFRAELLKNAAFDTRCVMGEDFLFNIEVLCNAPRVLLCTEAKYHYIQHWASVCNALPNAKVMRSHRDVFKTVAQLYSKRADVQMYFNSERLKWDMHCCSHIVRNPKLDLAGVKDEIREDVRSQTLHIMGINLLTLKDKGKLLLLGWAWWLYRILLLASKKTKGNKEN